MSDISRNIGNNLGCSNDENIYCGIISKHVGIQETSQIISIALRKQAAFVAYIRFND
jgi:hypothetical protein